MQNSYKCIQNTCKKHAKHMQTTWKYKKYMQNASMRMHTKNMQNICKMHTDTWKCMRKRSKYMQNAYEYMPNTCKTHAKIHAKCIQTHAKTCKMGPVLLRLCYLLPKASFSEELFREFPRHPLFRGPLLWFPQWVAGLREASGIPAWFFSPEKKVLFGFGH